MATVENHLLALLPVRQRKRVLRHAEAMPLDLSAVLVHAGDTPAHVYFPTRGFVSLVSAVEGQPDLEVGMVGIEGMVGTQVALGIARSPVQALVQGAGSALRIPVQAFRDELENDKALKQVLDRYVHVLTCQLTTSVACARFHQVGPRLARWLLMSHDRAQTDRFSVTQEFLAYMLGVRRSGVSEAAGGLQRAGLISYSRGEMEVLDRAKLEAAACTCYASDQQSYSGTFGTAQLLHSERS